MKKRIIFVDDEPREVQNLQRALGKMNDIWSLAFAGSGAEALELMAREPFDAIVADMRMTGMSGVELLNEVGKLYPKTLRFILSAFADRDLIMTCVWGTHQFISKPCDPVVLVSTVQRALALDIWLSNNELKELVSQMGSFPSLPATYLEVLKQLESPGASVQSISDVIATDLAVTAKLLQMVNSAFFGLPQKLTNPFEAVAILGVDTVKSLVLGIQVFAHFDKLKRSKFSMDELWAHSMKVANSAKRIALAETQDQQMADEAFTAGLMHDIGKLVLASNLAERYNTVLESAQSNKIPLWKAETESFGASHADIGAYLLGLWGMPITMLEATGLHHHPLQCFTKCFSSLTAVHVANAFESAQDGGSVTPQVDLEYLTEIGLEDRLDFWRQASSGTVAKANSEESPKPSKTPTPPQVAHEEINRSVSYDRWMWLAAPAAAGLVCVLVAWLIWQSWETDLAPTQLAGAPKATRARGERTSAANPTVPPKTMVTTEPGLAGERNLEDLPGQAKLTPAVAPASSAAKPGQEAVASSDTSGKPLFPLLKVQGIFYRGENSSVMINGKLLVKGEKIKGAEVIAIGSQSVTVQSGGELKVLTIR